MASDICHYCKRTKNEVELRPYGPGGAGLCFRCLKSTPEVEAAAGRAFAAQIEAAEAAGQGVSVLTDEGPNPSTEAERRMVDGIR